ncbi:MAG: 2,3-bisphosphoglycerate-independent phosphoglycerate mutase [Gammaproteobacteria bacterium]|jgi:2,3-bisphosphoglycerate-independent phosphoglycerate mutase|nr:2,3-bisphosphoglycerate-independent phosphoglycerate mutase [Gammaproteobacteria bacterium]MDP6734218.1 2,3-bisphosphoglycerate-independent phosphoglycerate mutase [Gammaproteobacteria bacterium]
MTAKKTALLLILDGWGYREHTDHNAIHAANSPVWDYLWEQRPHTLIHTSGESVGLPAGQMGNSEVGHTNLGAGRVVYQTLTRIDKDIEAGSFFDNAALNDAVNVAVGANSAVHVFGLMSPGGIHSHANQIMAMLKLATDRGAPRVFLHAFLDGRDTPPRSALPSLLMAEEFLSESGKGRVASICGRFYAMDRDNRWDRVQSAYRMLTEARTEFDYTNVTEALQAAYTRGEDDEFVQATLVGKHGNPSAIVDDGDVVVFMNFRADRARELTRSFLDDNFNSFDRTTRPQLGEFVTLTEYAADINTNCAYPTRVLDNVMGAYLASLGKTQLRIAETEKYAHVTFFFNGGREAPFENEERILIPSPDVKTYDLQPQMSAFEVTDKLVEAIESGSYDAIICNYANGDMVGHTGDFDASVKAVEAVDQCLKRIVAAIDTTGGELLITADHGNVEQMVDPHTNQALTSHTTGPVPLIYVGGNDMQFQGEGSLADIAPTLLTLMGIPIPGEMTGKMLLARSESSTRTQAVVQA